MKITKKKKGSVSVDEKPATATQWLKHPSTDRHRQKPSFFVFFIPVHVLLDVAGLHVVVNAHRLRAFSFKGQTFGCFSCCLQRKKKEHDKICFSLSFDSFHTWDHNLQNKWLLWVYFTHKGAGEPPAHLCLAPWPSASQREVVDNHPYKMEWDLDTCHIVRSLLLFPISWEKFQHVWASFGHGARKQHWSMQKQEDIN